MLSPEAVEPTLVGTVSDIMTIQVKTAVWSASVHEVACVMARNKLRRILILDDDDHVLGLLSLRDVLRRLISDQDHAETSGVLHNVGELVADQRPITVLPNVPLRGAAVVLADKKIGCLPIVDDDGCLLGVLSTSDLLEHLSGEHPRSGGEVFTFYNPDRAGNAKIPAFIRRANGDLVLPRSSLTNSDELPNHVQLAYDTEYERILVQFVAEPMPGDGSIRIKRNKEQFIIPASGFVVHFDLSGKPNAFDVQPSADGQRLVLTPRQG